MKLIYMNTKYKQIFCNHCEKFIKVGKNLYLFRSMFFCSKECRNIIMEKNNYKY